MKKILIVGGGGREHALAWKLKQSKDAGKIFVAPGNGGTAQIAENVPILPSDIKALADFAYKEKIDITVVGTDDPLALGIVDLFEEKGLPIFGPSKSAAELEWSKSFAKSFMAARGIPTAGFRSFRAFDEAEKYVAGRKFPLVVKASGLALGKGVWICREPEEAAGALRDVMVNKIFGEAGNEAVIEEYLEGPEISIHALSDGATYRMFPASQDHKSAFDGDLGPNTGGMGAIAPVPWFSGQDLLEVENGIVKPALRGLRSLGRPFAGVLYPGIKITPQGPMVLEFNARLGDPEAQSYMRLLKSDLLELVGGCVSRTLSEKEPEWREGYAVCVVLASGGYPGEYEKGKKITGIEEAEKLPEVAVFHAGTKYDNGSFYTSGGRVLGVSATGGTLEQAIDRAYDAADRIHFEKMHYRRDIGKKSSLASRSAN